MAGLASLALAALGNMAHTPVHKSTTVATSSTSSPPHDETGEIPMIDVTITDGHPDAVQNNVACATLTSTIYEDSSHTMNTTMDKLPSVRP